MPRRSVLVAITPRRKVAANRPTTTITVATSRLGMYWATLLMAVETAVRPEDVEGRHEEDAHQQPETDRAHDRRHVPLDAHVLHRLGQPAPLGGDLQADLLAHFDDNLPTSRATT